MASVSAGDTTPAGTVEFSADGAVVGSSPVLDGSARLDRTAVPSGDHTYVATFIPADPTVTEPSVSPPATVTVQRTSTTTSLSPVVDGRVVTLTARVSGDVMPVGRVDFVEAGAVVATAQLDAGLATVALGEVGGGTHDYEARYVPTDPSFAGSRSAVSRVVVDVPKETSRTVLQTPRTARLGSRPVIKVRVDRGATPATGKVVIKHAKGKSTLSLRDGAARLRLPRLPAGRFRVTASFVGNSATKPSTDRAAIRVTRR